MDNEVQTVAASAADTLHDVATTTSNDAILMIIVVAFCIVVAFIPLYIIYSRRDKQKLAQYIQREDRILQVIEKNSESNVKIAEVIAGVKTVLDDNNRHCDTCKAEQMAMMRTMAGKIDSTNMMVGSIITIMDERSDKNANS